VSLNLQEPGVLSTKLCEGRLVRSWIYRCHWGLYQMLDEIIIQIPRISTYPVKPLRRQVGRQSGCSAKKEERNCLRDSECNNCPSHCPDIPFINLHHRLAHRSIFLRDPRRPSTSILLSPVPYFDSTRTRSQTSRMHLRWPNKSSNFPCSLILPLHAKHVSSEPFNPSFMTSSNTFLPTCCYWATSPTSVRFGRMAYPRVFVGVSVDVFDVIICIRRESRTERTRVTLVW
jgi:hypothetical protein